MYSNAVFLQHCERAIAGLHPGGSNKGEAESAVITARMVSVDMILKTENSAEWDVKFNTVNQVSMMICIFNPPHMHEKVTVVIF